MNLKRIMTRQNVFIPLLVASIMTGLVQAAEKPVDSLEQWLKTSAAERDELKTQDFAEIPLTQSQATAAADQLWADYATRLRDEYKAEWEGTKISLGEKEMHFVVRKKGESPKDGRTLFISMHGGGNAPAQVNNQQWKNQALMYRNVPEGSLYVAPRAPTNTWNLWHEAHIDDFFDRLILESVLFENVDPNKVYLLGYSAGGDAVYQLAPRMADRFAAASMMAGHPNESTPEGLRNLPFSLWVGALDKGYNRNKVAAEYGKKLAALQKNDPHGYIHKVNLTMTSHWMKNQDEAAIPWMTQYTRNPYPSRVVWKQDDVQHDQFYWLGVPKEQAETDDLVIASIDGQTISIEKDMGVESLFIRLNDELIDLDKPVEVKQNGKTLFSGKVKRTIAAIDAALQRRPDRDAVYYAEISVQPICEKPKEAEKADDPNDVTKDPNGV